MAGRRGKRSIARIIGDDRAATAVEFAVTATLLIGFLLPVTDLGLGAYTKVRAQSAAEAGTEYAMLHGWNAAGVADAVRNATGLATISASPAPAQSCGCPSTSPAGIQSVGCGSTCPDGSAAGTYVTASAQAPYSTIFSYPGFDNPTTFTAVSVVRIK